jgi:hypothetical protein
MSFLAVALSILIRKPPEIVARLDEVTEKGID